MSEILIKILVEVILISGILGYYFTKREERMKKTIEEEFKKRDVFFSTRFNYKLPKQAQASRLCQGQNKNIIMVTDETIKIINNELAGKNAAIHPHDKMIWKVRADFFTHVFGAWRLAVKTTMAVPPGIPQKAWLIKQ